jgi:hypothetical protein
MVIAGIQTDVERREGATAVGCLAVLIVLLWSGVCAAEVLNPGFEATYDILPKPRVRPEIWDYTSHSSFDFYCTDLWQTEGGLAAGLYSRIGRSFSPGASHGVRQYVDLTGLQSIVFDVRLAAYPSGDFEHFEASVLVDGEVLWSQTVGGEYLDEQANVSHLSGWHWIELRETSLDNGVFNYAHWVQWDNLRVVEAPSVIEASVTLDPATLNVHACGEWITCLIELEEGYSVNEIDGATVTLQEIPAYIGPEGWAAAQSNEENVKDFDGDFDLERMVKFDRAAILAIVQPPQATLTIKGNLTSGIAFEGTATVAVVDNLAEFRNKVRQIRDRVWDPPQGPKGDSDRCREVRERLQTIRDKIQEARERREERQREKWDARDKDKKGGSKR